MTAGQSQVGAKASAPADPSKQYSFLEGGFTGGAFNGPGGAVSFGLKITSDNDNGARAAEVSAPGTSATRSSV